ncbi:MAG: ABC transporter permease [Candidatus Scalindua sp. AMX11]|nr:MAG: ABC transporter permease [Candidatus Scalindua sp.]NOG82545.1 ABC transporter permease [Planctomycetota bacterium]RZV93974.1 MAG: ABC transporter permease [Candidatus Scalindua sp. SCAELEC01]TDE63983.1 MAG: ABC transporter permease [Candidatus Scalindua sp. AMX11]GJQ57460.1 MAG: transport permease protein [Candidatus Scalindua sp.]
MKINKDSLTVIKKRSGWQIIDFQELIEYRDLFFFLVWRDIKALYAQTIMGFSWAIIQPLIQILMFSIIFGKVAKISTDGIPYILFSSVAIIPWTYMSQSMTVSSQSLVQGSALLGKIYFPRLIFPIAPILSKLVDFGFSIAIILGLMLYYRILPTWNLLCFPLFFIMMVSIPAGVGLWLSSLAIRFRDVKHAMPFFVRMLIYTAPIVYSASSIPEKYRIIYSLNPIVGVIEGYRACLLGTPFPWLYIWPGMITAAVLLISGAYYFKRMEQILVDVI